MGMVMKQLIKSEVHAIGTAALGLDPSTVDLSSIECIAASLRRAAGFLCPCSSRTLIDVVYQSLVDIQESSADLRGTIDDTLVAMIAYGDLVECSERLGGSGQNRTLLYASPPAFVLRQDGTAFLIGLTPDQTVLLPQSLSRGIEYSKHVRRLQAPENQDIRFLLKDYPLFELTPDQWLKVPGSSKPEVYLSQFDEVLSGAGRAGEITDLWILDPSKPVRYYRGRWVQPGSRSGRYLGRRRRQYGADLWCYLELEEGTPTKLIDLPLRETPWRACDEAWRLQSAIDSLNHSAQQYRVRTGSSKGAMILDLFSPIPRWVQRRLDYVGEPVLGLGCLLSYAIREAEIGEELTVLKEKLWMQEVQNNG
jgi:hypothetical protein